MGVRACACVRARYSEKVSRWKSYMEGRNPNTGEDAVLSAVLWDIYPKVILQDNEKR